MLLCTDGSQLATHALAAGLRVLAPAARTVVVTVIEPPDVSLVTGDSGFGAGVMSPVEYDHEVTAHHLAAEQVLRDTVSALGLDGAETRTLEGDPGHALCEAAAELPATVIVTGSHGRGGIKRALLGSVSDHLVRHAHCPVLVTRPE